MLKYNDQNCCSICDSKSMTKIIDFGKVALAGAFIKPEQFCNELYYPLRLYFCNDCYSVQVVDKVSPDILFKNYFYSSSSIRTLREHFIDYASEVTSRFLKPEDSTVIEFGCNDGVLLRPLADQGVRTVIGVDPAINIVKTINDSRVTVINDFFKEDVAKKIITNYGRVNMVIANNVYAHIQDIQGVTRAIKKVLNDDGIFVFEVHYLGRILDELQYDMIYHEHLYYHSFLSLEKHFHRYDMMIFDVKAVPIHAGSMRYYVCKKGSSYSSSVSERVIALKKSELANGFDRPETYTRFAADIADQKKKLIELLYRIKANGQTIVGYGASGRANTMIQFCGIDHRYLDYMIDDSPAKLGYYTPGSHFLIQSNSALQQFPPPDYLLIFAWSFFNEIASKCTNYFENGGRFILPLPSVQIITHPAHKLI